MTDPLHPPALTPAAHNRLTRAAHGDGNPRTRTSVRRDDLAALLAHHTNQQLLEQLADAAREAAIHWRNEAHIWARRAHDAGWKPPKERKAG